MGRITGRARPGRPARGGTGEGGPWRTTPAGGHRDGAPDGRFPPAMWVCILVVYPVAVADVPAALPARRAAARARAGAPGGQPRRRSSIRSPAPGSSSTTAASPHFLAKESVFKGFAGTLLRGAGQIPVKRVTEDAHEALGRGQAELDAGNVVVIYPEGTVTRDPGLVADAGQDRSGPAGAGHRRRRSSRSPSGGRSAVHDYHSKKLRPLPRTPADYLVGRAGRPRPPAGRCGRAAADRRRCCAR